MIKLKKENKEHIQDIFERKTGVRISGNKKRSMSFRAAAVTMAAMCVLALSGFGYRLFNSLDGDEVAFRGIYLGDGRVCVNVRNLSDKTLKFQEQIKLMEWVDSVEIPGDAGRIAYEGTTVEAHSEGNFYIDLSNAYDMSALEQPLGEGDWYYLVLTNNDFAFGQDWMVSVDFGTTADPAEVGFEYYAGQKKEDKKREYKAAKELTKEDFLFDGWVMPTEGTALSSAFGPHGNGVFSDHINIAGNKGDKVFAVTAGIIEEAGYESGLGNYLILCTEDGVRVKYGHLQDVLVQEGQAVEQGEEIGSMGATGMATGPNLSLTVYDAEGKAVNPLAK